MMVDRHGDAGDGFRWVVADTRTCDGAGEPIIWSPYCENGLLL